MGKLERCSAWFLLADGAVGLIAAAAVALSRHWPAGLPDSLPYASLLGLLSGILATRARVAGLLGGVLYYGLQTLSYYSPAIVFNVSSGISYATVIELADAVVVVNLVALAGLALTVSLLMQRLRPQAGANIVCQANESASPPPRR